MLQNFSRKRLWQVSQLGLLGTGALLGVAHAETDTLAMAEVTPERIQVTGSRILREGAIAPSPVTVISGQELVETGAMNIGEVLNALPSLAATFSLANSGRSIGTAGLNLLDLRGMGTARTLVLVDGRRHVSSSAGSAAVDTNAIPTAWIDSVEIITGGASAVYGADAVTGVVNFRLKRDIEGFDLHASVGRAEDSPYRNHKLTASYGSYFAQDRGNFALSAEVSGQNGINATQRRQTRTSFMAVRNPEDGDYRDDDGQWVHDGIPDTITVANAGWYDSSTAGNFYLVSDSGTVDWFIFNPDGSVRPQDLGTTYGQWGRCSDCEFLDLRRYNDLQPAFNRFNVNSKLNFELTPDTLLFAQASFVRNRGNSEGQPSFFEYDSALMVGRDNAYLDPSLVSLMDNYGIDQIAVHRFQEDAGRRLENNRRTTARFVAGVEGILGLDWNYELYGVFGETKLEQVNRNNLIRTNFAQSIDAIVVDGEIVCRDELARANGCVPTSIFGDNAINEQARHWFNTNSYSNSTIRQTVFSGHLNNSGLFELPAGFVGVSLGAEYRKEESESTPDSFAATGATFLNALQYEKGNFDVQEAFAELSIPVLADLPLIQDLVLDLAVRVADYSTIGTAVSWKTGLDWHLNPELRARATYSEALRAPNIGELFGPQNQTFFRVTDPCSVHEAQSETRRVNCAALGVPADFDPQATASSIEGLSGGNPELREEKSTSYTLGLVYQPDWLPGFSATLDYWSIEIDDAISSVSAQNILNKCVDAELGVNNQFCELVERNEQHELVLITSITQNVAALTAEGVDFELGYDFDALGGRFNTKLIGTYLDSRKTFSFQDSPEEFDQFAGTLGYARWQSNLSISYRYDVWSLGWKTRYLDRVSLFRQQELAVNPDPSDIMHYGSYFVTDVRLGYQFASGVQLTLGVDNVFDRNLPGVTTGTTGTTGLYNNIGRFYYSNVSYRF
ncbi:TonB-dependent receptor [Alkalimonas delamerensis]|uniref:TonB-dependent receptor n=1 Tax=Alkalimonas delamerensis TaxID=265981 RepID=A0ABT9GTF4_9GAMM|nr:TonB-dependent receptor [Alkalimonas delamerensis]MDP4530253.1 TonB-dependent receptor [Alkalimonas delamerensis]